MGTLVDEGAPAAGLLTWPPGANLATAWLLVEEVAPLQTGAGATTT
jgi:hypothetical protein